MQFLTVSECEAWLHGRSRSKPSVANSAHHARVPFAKEAYRLYWFARQISDSMMQDRQPCLVWVEEWDIWEQNLHLYYRLRQGYGDHRLLPEAPGHLFLGYEMEDLATLLQISMLNGWGGTILTHFDYLNAFFSHDEFVDLYSNDEVRFRSTLQLLTG
jgi:hypothetical protein